MRSKTPELLGSSAASAHRGGTDGNGCLRETAKRTISPKGVPFGAMRAVLYFAHKVTVSRV